MEDEDQGRVWPPAPTHHEPLGSDGQPAKTYLQVRLFSTLLFFVGLGLAWWIKTDVDSGTKASANIIIVTPAILLTSLAAIIDPRITLAGMKGVAPQPIAFKFVGYAVVATGIGIGLYIVFTFFK